MKLTQMKMRLEVLQAADQMIFHVSGVEYAVLVLRGYAEESAKAFSTEVRQWPTTRACDVNDLPVSAVHVVDVNSGQIPG